MNRIDYFRGLVEESYNNKDYNKAKEICELLFREQYSISPIKNLGTADDLYNLAVICEKLDDHAKAVEYYTASLRLIFSIEGLSRRYAERLRTLAVLLGEIGKQDVSLRIHFQYMDLVKELYGGRSIEYIDSLTNAANAAIDSNLEHIALGLLEKANPLIKKYGTPSEHVTNLLSLSNIFVRDESKESAIKFAEDALEVAERHLSREEMASISFYLAGLHESYNDYNDAMEMYDLSIDLITQAVGPEHSAYVIMLFRKANFLVNIESYEESLILFSEILDLYQRKYGKFHVFYTKCLRAMSSVYTSLGDKEKAEETLIETIKIKRWIGDDVFLDLVYIVRFYLKENRLDDAKDMLIYSLICANAQDSTFDVMLETMAENFSDLGDSGEHILADTIVMLENLPSLDEVTKKWMEWELTVM